MLNILGNNKLRLLNFECVMAVNVPIMYINFQINLQVLLEVMVKLA